MKRIFSTLTCCLAALLSTSQLGATNKEIYKVNLEKAEKFLSDNASNEGIVILTENKLQFKQIKKGDGKICSEKDTPIVSYKGTLIDGKIFDQSSNGVPFPLNRVIKGFKEGLIGMQAGEIRELYIHPDYGYGDATGMPFPPNSLLIFRVEIKGYK